MITFRQAKESDLEALIDIHSLAFPDSRDREARRKNFCNNMRGAFSDLYVAEHNEHILAHAFLIPLQMRLFGERCAVGGIASVAVSPQARGQSVAKQLLRHLLQLSYERGDLFQCLFPFSYKFYADLGFAPIHPMLRVHAPVGAIPAHVGAAKLRRLSAADSSLLLSIHGQTLQHAHGAFERTSVWAQRVLSNPNRFVFVGSLAQSFIIFSISEGAEGAQTIEVTDWGATTWETQRELLALIRSLKDQATAFRMTVRPDDQMLLLLSEYKAPTASFAFGHLHPIGQLVAGAMMRMVHPTALKLLHFEPQFRCSLPVVCEDNVFGVRKLRLHIAHGKADVEEVHAFHHDERPIVFDAPALTRWILQVATFHTLANMHSLELDQTCKDALDRQRMRAPSLFGLDEF